MTPEEAYQITIKKWRGAADGTNMEDPTETVCGFCLFSIKMEEKTGKVERECPHCPVERVFGEYCVQLPIWKQYWPDKKVVPWAKAVIAFLEEHKDELIDAGYEIMANG